MNNKAQLGMLGLMFAIMFLIATVAFIEPVKDQVELARNSDNLDCENTSISTGRTSACIVIDWYLPYFIGVALAVGMGFFSMKRVFSNSGK